MKPNSRESLILVSQIAARAVRMAREHGVKYAHIDAMTDLGAFQIMPQALAGRAVCAALAFTLLFIPYF